MDNNGSQDVEISGTRFDLTPALTSLVRQQTDRLFRHAFRISLVRIDLELDDHAGTPCFVAKGHVRTVERVVFASVSTDECQKSVACLVDHLDHALAR